MKAESATVVPFAEPVNAAQEAVDTRLQPVGRSTTVSSGLGCALEILAFEGKTGVEICTIRNAWESYSVVSSHVPPAAGVSNQ